MAPECTLSDADLVGHVLAGRKEAFGTLVRRYMSALQSLAFAKTGNQADAEEITQEAFLKGFRYLDRLKDPGRFAPWMAAIVRRVALDFLARRPRLEGLAEELAATRQPTAPEAESRDLRQFLRERIHELDEQHRDVLLLYYFADQNTRQIAELLAISSEAAQKRLQRAREALGNGILDGLRKELGYAPPAESHAARVMAIVAGTPAPWLAQASLAAQKGAAAARKTGWLRSLANAPLALKGAAAAVVIAVAGAWMLGMLAKLVTPAEGRPEARSVEAQASALDQQPADRPAAPADPLVEPADSTPSGAPAAKPLVAAGTGSVPKSASPPRSIAPLGYPGTTVPENALDTLAGTVYDVSGAPLAAAKVWVARTGMQARDTRDALTDAQGRFALEVPDGQWRVQARKDALGGEADCGPGGQIITEGNGRRFEMAVHMRQNGLVSGCIRDRQTRQPIPYAQIWTDERALITADAQGAYTIEGLTLDTHTLMTLCPGYERQYVAFNTVLRPEALLDIALDRGGKVVGTVVDGAGRPLAYAWVCRPLGGQGCLGGSFEVCDENGRFEFDGLPAGKREDLRAQVPCYVNFCPGPPEIEGETMATIHVDVPAYGEAPAEVRFLFDATPQEEARAIYPLSHCAFEAALRGRVTDALGDPVRDFRILVQAPLEAKFEGPGIAAFASHIGYSFTSPDGSFIVTWPSLKPGMAARVVAVADGHGEAVLDMAPAHALKDLPPADALTLRLTAPNRLSVRVTDAARRPLAGAAVTVLAESIMFQQSFDWSDAHSPTYRPNTAITDATGWAHFEALSVQAGVVCVEKEGYACARTSWPAREAVLTMTLEPEGLFEGCIRDKAGAPLATRAYVLLRTGGEDPFDFMNPDHHRFQCTIEPEQQGEFRFAGLPAGQYEVKVSWKASNAAAEEASASAPLYTDEFTIEPGATISAHYPEDATQSAPDRWAFAPTDPRDLEARQRLIGAWRNEHALADGRRVIAQLEYREDGTYENVINVEGEATTLREAGLFRIQGGQLQILADGGRGTWPPLSFRDENTLVFRKEHGADAPTDLIYQRIPALDRWPETPAPGVETPAGVRGAASWRATAAARTD